MNRKNHKVTKRKDTKETRPGVQPRWRRYIRTPKANSGKDSRPKNQPTSQPTYHQPPRIQHHHDIAKSHPAPQSSLLLLGRDCADIQHVVAADEGVPILVLQLTVDILLSLPTIKATSVASQPKILWPSTCIHLCSLLGTMGFSRCFDRKARWLQSEVFASTRGGRECPVLHRARNQHRLSALLGQTLHRRHREMQKGCQQQKDRAKTFRARRNPT